MHEVAPVWRQFIGSAESTRDDLSRQVDCERWDVTVNFTVPLKLAGVRLKEVCCPTFWHFYYDFRTTALESQNVIKETSTDLVRTKSQV
jgi:hypothetical protein